MFWSFDIRNLKFFRILIFVFRILWIPETLNISKLAPTFRLPWIPLDYGWQE